MSTTPSIEWVIKRDRAVVSIGLLLIVMLAWSYLVYLSWGMQTSMDGGPMRMGMNATISQVRSWSPVDFTLMLTMWSVMMMAMMVPTAAPMLLTFATINRKRLELQQPFVPTGVFLLGYLLVWTAFALAATTAQWGLNGAALLSPMLASTNQYLGGGLLIAAGVFQWSPLKYACLNRCRSPLGFLMTEWREGHKGALVMGLRHGVVCLMCCWVLMALLFVLGVMNLVWIAALSGFVLIEKIAPGGHWISRTTGVLLVLWGIWIILATQM